MSEAGKGDTRRPCRTDKSEYDLRYAFAYGLVTREQYEERYQELLAQGKITRDGRPVKHVQ